MMRPLLRGRGPAIDVVIASPRWKKTPPVARLVRKAITTAAPASMRGSEVSVVLTDNAAIRALNRRWRRRNKPTNVLSFPAPPAGRSALKHLGDIFIAYETTKSEAAAEGKPFHHHLVHLAVHGFLHLMGYDHDSDEAAAKMERRERRILARLDIPDPYAAHDCESES